MHLYVYEENGNRIIKHPSLKSCQMYFHDHKLWQFYNFVQIALIFDEPFRQPTPERKRDNNARKWCSVDSLWLFVRTMMDNA